MIFQWEIGDVYRLKVPFDDVYTSVFLIKGEDGNVLVDCATTSEDVEKRIAPALLKTGLTFKDIKYLVLTHQHSDHAGGKERILQLNPNIVLIEGKSQIFLNGLTRYELKGHTLDCIGVFDERSGTLIAGDGLQGAGVGKYKLSLESKEAYFQTLANIKKNKRIENILFSHAYEPWKKDSALGREEVEKRLQDCEICAKGE